MSNDKNESNLKALNQLLEFSSPEELRQSIGNMFHAYLLDVDKVMPVNYKQVVEDHFILNQFLNQLEEIVKID